MTIEVEPTEAVMRVRRVRIAAHELSNVCAAICGGTTMALSIERVTDLGEPLRGLSTRAPGHHVRLEKGPR